MVAICATGGLWAYLNAKKTAIALCRVSTQRQLLDGNLEPQEERINRVSEQLGVPVERWWRLAISSRKGKNVKRKDLLEMLSSSLTAKLINEFAT